MNPALQETLLQLFEYVQHDPDSLPPVPIDEWQEGSTERQLLISFSIMMEQVQQRVLQLRRADEQLREKEELYRAIFEATADGLSINDLEDGRVIEANPALCNMFGYTYEEFINLPPTATIHPDTYYVVDEVLQKVQTGSQFQNHFVAMRKDGTVFNAEGRGTPFIYKGKPHILGSIRDITEQVQAVEQLREKEEQYRSIFEATTDAMAIASLEDGIIVEVNPAECRMFGYTYEEMLGMHPAVTVHPDSLTLVTEANFKIQAGNQFQTQALALRKDGTPFPVEAYLTPFIYKGKPHTLSVARDITERIEAEKQLREKEEQYRGIFEAATDAMFITTLEAGVIVEANPAACKMLGYSYEEMIGLSPAAIVHPDSLFQAGNDLQALQASLSASGNMALQRKEGTTFPTEGRSTILAYKGRPHVLAVLRDISDRVEAERRLREREEQYRSIFEATSDGLIIVDLNGFIVQANPAAYRMYGYTYEEFIGLQGTAITAPDSLYLLTEALQMITLGEQLQAPIRSNGLRKDGTTFLSEGYGTPFMYNGNSQILAIVRDITEREKTEQELREREEQYRGVFEATYDGISIINLDGCFVEVNPAYCSMFGYTREELIGLHASILAAPEFLTVVDESLEMLKAGRDFQTVGQGLRKDGTMFYLESHSTTFTYRGKPHSLGVSRDITERIEAEKQLSEREEQYRSVFEATYDGLIILDMNGFYVEVNPAYCSMFGYTREELIGLHASVLTAPEDLPILDDALKTLKTGRGFQTVGQSQRKDGTTFYSEGSGTTFTYRGKPHVLGVSRDVTEQVQAQELLEQRVDERTRELASLLEISHTVASTLQLKPLLGLILDQLKMVVDYTGASILTVERDDLVFLDSRSPTPEEQLMQLHLLPQRLGPIWEMITSGQPIRLADMRDESPLAQSLRVGIGGLMDTTFSYVRACLFVPLTLKEQTIGMLVLTSSETDAFTRHHADLALAIANQAAIAIENARLYEQAQELAAVEERQRLARELHDSVSQALYGISLGVHTARMQLDRDPRDLAESLDYVLELAEAALVEMRALIFELRPESLETEGIVTALTKQAAALQARQNIAVNTDLCAEPDLPLRVKQDLYRIAQEGLHNTVKHAHASKIELRLQQTREAITLEVCDNGRGFDATASFPGHLGLHSMQERVTGLGGELHIKSTPGQGTCIQVHIPVRLNV